MMVGLPSHHQRIPAGIHYDLRITRIIRLDSRRRGLDPGSSAAGTPTIDFGTGREGQPNCHRQGDVDA